MQGLIPIEPVNLIPNKPEPVQIAETPSLANNNQAIESKKEVDLQEGKQISDIDLRADIQASQSLPKITKHLPKPIGRASQQTGEVLNDLNDKDAKQINDKVVLDNSRIS